MSEPFGPRSRASRRANLRCLALSASIAFAALSLVACGKNPVANPPEYGILRMRLYQQCLEHFPKSPNTTGGDYDMEDIPTACSNSAYYIANSCDDPKACLMALTAETPDDGSIPSDD